MRSVDVRVAEEGRGRSLERIGEEVGGAENLQRREGAEQLSTGCR